MLTIQGGRRMKRDDELLRKLLLEMEESEDALHIYHLVLASSPEDAKAYYHLRLLVDEGFLEETGKSGGVFRMTNKGHDFTAAIRSDTVWNKTKDAAAQVSGVSISILKDIALGIVRDQLVKMGVPLA
ncbi:DUF2513 domain-containing protein [Cereibacter sphaeroides]|uniref:DUF2513 domain-containing protein n=1 Tax=Cereibacter sphaeroides TaxID=1063 RepID=UPI00067462BA|nr:DUF2513 domain-containing protein [Cereibacter sphaeroides]